MKMMDRLEALEGRQTTMVKEKIGFGNNTRNLRDVEEHIHFIGEEHVHRLIFHADWFSCKEVLMILNLGTSCSEVPIFDC